MVMMDACEHLYDSIIKETGITAESFDYDNKSKIISFTNLNGINTQKDFE
jgi:hypothetical protein